MYGNLLSNMYFIVLDAGTSCIRCLVLNQMGEIVASKSNTWHYEAENNTSKFAVSFNSEKTWNTTCELIKNTLKNARINIKDIGAITATSQRQGVVFLDTNGRELYLGPNLDLRAIFEGGYIDDQYLDEVFSATGHIPSLLFAPAKLRWFKLHKPEVFGKITSILTLADWLLYKLGNNMISEVSLASEIGMIDINKVQWYTVLLEKLDLIQNDHIPLVKSGTVVAKITKKASEDTGLPQHTPIVTAGADTQCGLLGMGIQNDNHIGVVAGWSTPIQTVINKPILSKDKSIWTGCYLMPNKWVIESNAGDGGNSYHWLSEIIFENENDIYDRMEMLAHNSPIGSQGTLAFLGPSRMDMTKLGMRQGGIIFPVPLTFNKINQSNLVRASLEAMAYAIKINIQQIADITGKTPSKIVLGGGMIQTQIWNKILADVIGNPIEVSNTPYVSAVGAYMCASIGIGEFNSFEEADFNLQDRTKIIENDSTASLEYIQYYEQWLQYYQWLESIEI